MTRSIDILVGDGAGLGARITSVESRHVGLPTGIRPFRLPDGRQTPTDLAAVLVRVTDSDGQHGYSLLWTQHPHQAPLLEAALRYLSDSVTLRPLVGAPRITEDLRNAVGFFGSEGPTAFALSGLQMAIEDLICRRRGAGLSTLLGRRRDSVRCYQTGLMLHASVEELMAEAKQMYSEGVRAVKMLVGKPTLAEDVDRIAAVRETLPDDAALMVDALQRWDTGTALEAADRFARFGLQWIEDPLRHDDISGYARLNAESPVPIATGETAFTRAAHETLLDIETPYIIAELERVGGICAWADLAVAVVESGATMLSHLYPHTSAHLLACLPEDQQIWLEYVPWFDTVADHPLTLHNGVCEVPDGPGAGFAPDPDKTEGLALGPWIRLTS